MSSSPAICTQALGLLGQPGITSLDDSTDRGIFCKQLYPAARAAVMRAHPWNCLIKRTKLAPEATAPAFGFSAQFPLPGDCLRVIAVGEDGDQDFQIEGRRILSSGTELRLTYIANVPEPGWDASLQDALAFRMARDLGYPITKSASMVGAMDTLYSNAIKAARNIDAQENPSPELGEYSPLVAGRF